MDRDETVRRIKGELEFCCAGGSPGNISQPGYRDSLFSVFIDQYRRRFYEGASPMSGDWIQGKLLELWTEEKRTSQALKEVTEDFCLMWREWQYAWDRIDDHPEAGGRTR